MIKTWVLSEFSWPYIPAALLMAIFYSMDLTWWVSKNEKHEEMMGISVAVGQDNFPIHDVVFVNTLYEM